MNIKTIAIDNVDYQPTTDNDDASPWSVTLRPPSARTMRIIAAAASRLGSGAAINIPESDYARIFGESVASIQNLEIDGKKATVLDIVSRREFVNAANEIFWKIFSLGIVPDGIKKN